MRRNTPAAIDALRSDCDLPGYLLRYLFPKDLADAQLSLRIKQYRLGQVKRQCHALSWCRF
jgi:hypothetical protein